MKSTTIEFREIMVNHIVEEGGHTPADYGVSTWKEMVECKIKEMHQKNPRPYDLGKFQAEGGGFLHYYEDIVNFMVDSFGYDRKRIEAKSSDELYNLYHHYLGKAFEDLYNERFNPEIK